jgi:ligand-binding sensor domain-containing protein/signal transduction histidine kinase
MCRVTRNPTHTSRVTVLECFTRGSSRLEYYLLKSKAVILLFCLLSALGASSRAVAAESGVPIRDFVVRTWGREEGLPDDSVTAILQSRDGFLWVGTGTRLVRFDGVKFTEFSLPLADTNAPARITALCEDAAGKLWVGTHQDGLFRLDESGVTSYRKTSGLVDDNVTSLSADAEGRVWIGTGAGLSRWDGKRFTSFTSREGLSDVSVIGVHVARSGVVWITTRSGMYQFKDGPASADSGAAGRITAFEFETDSQGRRPEHLGAYEDRRGNLWAFGDTYLINLTVEKLPQVGQKTAGRYNHFRGMNATRIWSLCEGRDGRLWIGTGGRELVCFDDNNFQPVPVSELDRANEVRAICEDREGNLWLGTSGGGLMELLPQPMQVLRAERGLPPGAATCLATDASGRVFVAFEAGGLFAGEAGRFERFAVTSTGEAQNLIAALRVGTDETLWVATLGNGLFGARGGRKVHLTTLNGLSHDSVPALCATTNGTIWAGTRAGMLHRIRQGEITSYGKEHGLPGTPVTALYAARDGTIWLGTEDGQVLRQSHQDRFDLVHQMTAAAGPSIIALHEDARGRMWIGTAAAGLACWTGQRCPSWSVQNGLPDDSVYGVLVDADGDLWLACGRGIFRAPQDSVQDALVKGEPFRCKLMLASRSADFQLPSPEFGGVRALQAHDGRLWFATPDGLVVVDRSGPDLSRILSPPVYLENIYVNGKPWDGRGDRSEARRKDLGGRGRAGRLAVVSTNPNAPPIRFPTDVESVEFEFTAPSFVAPDKLNFRYQLEGEDRDWVDAGPERRARYGRLAYGDYRFRVAVSQVDGVWSEAVEQFTFRVPTPLWRAPVAIAFYILTAAAVVAGLARVVSTRRLRAHLARLEQLRMVERERMRIAQDMHDDIGSKLTKISFLSERAKMELGQAEGDPNSSLSPDTRHRSPGGAGVAAQIESIATTSRELLQTLDEIVWAVNPRNDSLEHLAAYLSHYAAEYFQNTEVQCEMRLPRDLPHVPLSAELRHNLFLAFEEVLNNALKHSGASKVGVEMSTGRPEGTARRVMESFQITVADNGRGFDVAASPLRAEPAKRRGGEAAPVASTVTVAPVGRRVGNGLLNMRQRLAVVGGECLVHSEPGKGTTVTLRIPLSNSTKVKS